MAYVPDEADDRSDEIGGQAYKLFVCYCKRANMQTGESFAESERIAKEKGWKVNHLYTYRKELATAGWINFDGDKVKILFGFPRPSKSNNRTCDSPKTVSVVVQELDSVSPEIGPPKSKNRTKTSPKTVPAYKEEPDHEPTQLTNPLEPEEIHVELLPADQQVFEFWKLELNHPKSKLDAKRQRAVKARLKDGYSVDDLCNAVRGCKLSPFYMGANKQDKKFDDLEMICRSGSKVDEFLGAFENPPTLSGNGVKPNGNGYKSQSERQDDSLEAIARHWANPDD